MSSDRKKLGSFLAKAMDWDWLDFCIAEKDMNYKSSDSAVLALIRLMSEKKLGAIRMGIERVDGKLETPIQIVFPKVFLIFPHAKTVEGLPEGVAPAGDQPDPSEFDEPIIEEPLATLTPRETLRRMADTGGRVVPLILKKKKDVEAAYKAYGKEARNQVDNIPAVKSVISANLLHLAIEENNFEAITELFDQLDGKLVETIRVLDSRSGGDGNFYLTQYSSVAPAGSVKNDDGIYMIENKVLADQWKSKFKQK